MRAIRPAPKSHTGLRAPTPRRPIPPFRRAWAAGALGLLLLLGARARAAELPEGEGQLLVRQQCGICHGLEIVAQQRLSRDAWTGVLDDMKRFGAPFDPDQRRTLLEYLAAYLGPPGAVPAQSDRLPPGQGVELVRIHCAICHNLELVRAQRLSRAAWEGVLSDMRRFGAVFDDTQRAVILDYLALHLAP